MPRPPTQGLTDAELRVMNVLWERGRASVGDVVDGIAAPAKPAYNTVLTTLRILERKGYVTHEKDGRAFTYAAARRSRPGTAARCLAHPAAPLQRLAGAPRAGPARARARRSRGNPRAARARRKDERGSCRAVEAEACMIVLATWLWQGIAIACATALLLSLARNAAAATRHAIWWVALVAVVAAAVRACPSTLRVVADPAASRRRRCRPRPPCRCRRRPTSSSSPWPQPGRSSRSCLSSASRSACAPCAG